MKTRILWGIFCLALLASLAACKKSGGAGDLPPMEINGVKVDMPLLMADVRDDQPEVRQLLRDAQTKIRYGQNVEGMMQLDELSKNTTLTEKQKQLLAKVMEQLKQAIAKAPAQ